MDEAEISKHVENCPRCKHATRIGSLCRVGRAWIEKEFLALADDSPSEERVRVIRVNEIEWGS